MNRIALVIVFFISNIFALRGQEVDSIVSHLMVSFENENWEDVEALFSEFAEKDPENAEVFYWVRGSKKANIAPTLLLDLAKSYQKRDNTDKAIALYKQYCQLGQCSPDNLLEIAQYVTELGDIRLTCQVYEKIVEIDANNFNANIFLGNYLYLRAERERKKLESEYQRISKPTRMQYAEFRKGLKTIYISLYDHAREHLEKAYHQIESQEVKKTLGHISDVAKIAI